MADSGDGGSPKSKSMADRLDWITPTAVPPRTLPPATFTPAGHSTSFPYKPRLVPMLVAILFFGFCGWFMNQTANTNDRGLILEHLIHFSPEGATLFYRAIAWVSFMFVALAVFVGLPQTFLDRRLVLEPDSILVPRGLWSTQRVRIPLDSIREVQMATYRRKYHFITIYHDGGKCKINASHLPGVDDYQTVLAWINRDRKTQE